MLRSGGNSRAKLARLSEASVPAAHIRGPPGRGPRICYYTNVFQHLFDFFQKYFLKILKNREKRLYNSKSAGLERVPDFVTQAFFPFEPFRDIVLIYKDSEMIF